MAIVSFRHLMLMMMMLYKNFLQLETGILGRAVFVLHYQIRTQEILMSYEEKYPSFVSSLALRP